jgi:membrane-associated phospholipid phosphatase
MSGDTREARLPPAPVDAHVRRARALAIAGICLVALALVWTTAALIPAVHREDAVVLQAFLELERPRVDRWATSLTALLEPLPFVLCGVALLAVAIVRHRERIALSVVAILALAPLTSEALKPLLATSHVHIGLGPRVPSASWPSGHSTAALALALCAVLVVPRRLRAATAVLGGVFAIAIGCSQLILGRHMPSDVLGGYLVAAFWTALAIAALRVTELHSRPRT